MKELHKHCYDLAMLFTRPTTSLSWMHAAEWLRMASGVTRVDVDLSRFDESFGMCEVPDEYISKRSDLLSGLAAELTTFAFIWGSLETVIEKFNQPGIPHPPTGEKRGDSPVLRACYFLKKEFEPHPLLPYYSDLVGALCHLLTGCTETHCENLGTEFELNHWIGMSGIGLNVVRLIRNRFVHGVLGFPEPEEWSGDKPPDIEIIHLSSRIVLLSIQMFLIALHKKNPIELTIQEEASEDEPRRNLTRKDNTIAFLRTLHLLEEEDEDQLFL
jgi:hypothetical protein